MPQKTAIIIGAGPAGLTAAYELLETAGIKPIILEKSEDIGGLSKTVNYKGNRMDIGGHRFFSKSERVNNWWLKQLPLEKNAAVSPVHRAAVGLLGRGPFEVKLAIAKGPFCGQPLGLQHIDGAVFERLGPRALPLGQVLAVEQDNRVGRRFTRRLAGCDDLRLRPIAIVDPPRRVGKHRRIVVAVLLFGFGWRGRAKRRRRMPTTRLTPIVGIRLRSRAAARLSYRQDSARPLPPFLNARTPLAPVAWGTAGRGPRDPFRQILRLS